MTEQEYEDAHGDETPETVVPCPYCESSPGWENVETVCVWCKGTTWIDEDLTWHEKNTKKII